LDSPVRQIVYRRRPGGPAYRVLFTVEADSSEDAPFVNVIHVRHGAQAPMNEAEASAIEEDR